MQGKVHLYEYAVIRIVPLVEREEFMNVGVILYCADKKYLDVLYHLDADRLLKLSGQLDMADLQCYMDAFTNICRGSKDAGPVARLTVPERFRWLTATRSTVVQTSKVHPGFCEDPAVTLKELFTQLVL